MDYFHFYFVLTDAQFEDSESKCTLDMHTQLFNRLHSALAMKQSVF